MRPKLHNSNTWLRKRYVDEGKTIEEMAVEAGCSKLTIRRRLQDLGLIR